MTRRAQVIDTLKRYGIDPIAVLHQHKHPGPCQSIVDALCDLCPTPRREELERLFDQFEAKRHPGHSCTVRQSGIGKEFADVLMRWAEGRTACPKDETKDVVVHESNTIVTCNDCHRD